ncbi:hypothetical protein LMG18095_04189 [Ralstonia thomasii]|uniref:Transmembrane protein n=1 Tax=Ralstonia thomasii TaxID=3058596 RepID=A0ABM9JUH6_9RALS|nr:hypothetical protein LMG18095_04189 [Ralstonia sp. LMG 18095]
MTQANRWALVLATGATGTALCLSVLAGWQRGGSLAERLAWVAIGVVLVASAHLLPALVRGTPLAMRAVAGVFWIACMATACQGHATFFLLAQRHAGEMRAVAVPSVASPAAGRSLTAVMAERAEVTARLATANTQRCTGHCSTLEIRRVSLAAKLDALDAEAHDIRRRQTADDQAMTQRDSLGRSIQSRRDLRRYSARPSCVSICCRVLPSPRYWRASPACCGPSRCKCGRQSRTYRQSRLRSRAVTHRAAIRSCRYRQGNSPTPTRLSLQWTSRLAGYARLSPTSAAGWVAPRLVP